jgi:hypothetical protein
MQKKGVKIGVEAAFAAMQSAQVIAATPQVAGVADMVMKSAGYQEPVPEGANPDFPLADGSAGLIQNSIKDRRTGVEFTPPSAPGSTVASNTDPLLPAKPASPQVGEERGIETNRADSGPKA